MKIRNNAILAVLVALNCSNTFADNSPDEVQNTALSNYPRLGIWVDENLNIKEISQGAPSQTAGLLVGDKILSIESQPINNLTKRARNRLLAGQSGTISHLIVMRGHNKYSVAVTRANLNSKNLAGKNQSIESIPQKLEPSALDKEFITVSRQTANTDQIYQQVLEGLALLPDSVKRNLRNNDVTIVIIPSRGEFNETEGGCAYQIRTKKVMIVEYDNRANKEINFRRIPLTTLHELGHAFDATNGKISKRPAYMDLYNEEAAKVLPVNRVQLAYFLPANLHTNSKDNSPKHDPPSECFASLFAAKYLQSGDARLDILKTSFPKTYEFVQSLKLLRDS